jgi:hypothetical protein
MILFLAKQIGLKVALFIKTFQLIKTYQDTLPLFVVSLGKVLVVGG